MTSVLSVSGRPEGYLGHIARTLWPEPAIVRLERRSNASVPPGSVQIADLLLLPGARDPRLMLPASSRRAAAAATRRYAEPRSALAQLRARMLAAALRTGIGEMLLTDRLRVYVPESVASAGAAGGPAATLLNHLERLFQSELHVSMYVGPARANRKPVLQLLAADGRPVGFAKVGVNQLTRELVHAEACALSRLANIDLSFVTVPTVLHAGRWREAELLVQSTLPVWLPRADATEARRMQAMREITRSGDMSVGPLGQSSYWRRLVASIERLDDRTPKTSGGAALRLALSRLEAQSGRVLSFGAWHGDWNPGNMAVLADQVLVWDWERYASDVPMGFDALHHHLQTAITRNHRGPTAAVRSTLTIAPRVLAPFGVRAIDAEVIAVLYLLHLAARYLRDGQAEAGAEIGHPTEWLVPVVNAVTERLSPPAP